jgi:hypothetical protein
MFPAFTEGFDPATLSFPSYDSFAVSLLRRRFVGLQIEWMYEGDCPAGRSHGHRVLNRYAFRSPGGADLAAFARRHHRSDKEGWS